MRRQEEPSERFPIRPALAGAMVGQLSSPGICGYLFICFPATHSAVTSALFLGRSRLLHSRRARHFADGKPHSAHYGFKRAPALGNGMACAVVESGGLRTRGDTHSHVSSECVFSTGRVPPGGVRCQYSSGDCGHIVHGSVSGIFRAKLSRASGSCGGGIHLLGIGSLCGGASNIHIFLLCARRAGEGNRNSDSDSIGGVGSRRLFCAHRHAWEVLA
jgi:hypothetical protein